MRTQLPSLDRVPEGAHASRNGATTPRAASPLISATLFAAASGLFLLGWLIVWLLSHPLSHGEAFSTAYLAAFSPVGQVHEWGRAILQQVAPSLKPPAPPAALVTALVAGFALAGVGYLGGVMLLDRGLARAPGAQGAVLAVALAAQALLIVSPGLYTTDVFSYVMYGHIAAIHGFNPYLDPPSAFPLDPVLSWINPFWHGAVSVYGPLWTNVSWVLGSAFGSHDLVVQVLAYKGLLNLAHLANLFLVWWLLGRLLDGRNERVTAFAVFAWNPVILFETVANAHNDGLMVTLLLLSLVPLVAAGQAFVTTGARSLPWLAAIGTLALSALVKYTTVLAAPYYVVAWARRLGTWRGRAAAALGAALLAAVLALALYGPWLFWPGFLTPILNAAGGSGLYMNSVPDAAAVGLADVVSGAVPDEGARLAAREEARFWFKVATRALLVGWVSWEAYRLWRRPSFPSHRHLLRAIVAASVRTFLVLLVVVLSWVWPWYFSWPLALAALLGWRSILARVTVGYTLTSLPVMYAHHYLGGAFPQAALLLYAVPPLLAPLVTWVQRRRAKGALPT